MEKVLVAGKRRVTGCVAPLPRLPEEIQLKFQVAAHTNFAKNDPMSSTDEFAKSYSILTSLLKNLPPERDVDEKWVHQYHAEVARLEKAAGIKLDDFKVPGSELERREIGHGGLGRGPIYSRALSCERSVLVHKLEALLGYFSLRTGAPNTGYQPPDINFGGAK